jgi:1,4-dihydroxy-2-naphthoyl-CoA hydrolase
MKIWKKEFTKKAVNAGSSNMVRELDIEFTEFGDDYVIGKMPVNHKTKQPFGLLHGGASVVLAESLGSMAGFLCIDDPRKAVVGLEINANHLRAVRDGFVYGKAKPIHLGSKTQVWGIDITDEQGKMVCVSRLTLAVIDI